MRILEEGRIPKKEKRFTCAYCSCVFIASDGEYNPAGQLAYLHDGVTAYCKCPTCKRTAYSTE